MNRWGSSCCGAKAIQIHDEDVNYLICSDCGEVCYLALIPEESSNVEGTSATGYGI